LTDCGATFKYFLIVVRKIAAPFAAINRGHTHLFAANIFKEKATWPDRKSVKKNLPEGFPSGRFL
jgi:hypothetical protein